MLWTLRFEWPSGAQFVFNCYLHWNTLVIRAGYEMGHFLFIKEGVTQGDPLAMVVYGLVILPLIRFFGRPTPASPSPGMRMTLGREAPSGGSGSIWTT